jgi:predicted nucleic acid-binding protein
LVCAVQVAEFYRGVRPTDRENWDAFFSTLTYLDISLPAARRAGVVRYEFDRRGFPLQLTDTLIAAASIEEGVTLVTNNVRHYEPVVGVRLMRL